MAPQDGQRALDVARMAREPRKDGKSAILDEILKKTMENQWFCTKSLKKQWKTIVFQRFLAISLKKQWKINDFTWNHWKQQGKTIVVQRFLTNSLKNNWKSMILHEIIEKTTDNLCFSAILDEIFEKQWKINDFGSNHWKRNEKSTPFSDSRLHIWKKQWEINYFRSTHWKHNGKSTIFIILYDIFEKKTMENQWF